MKRHGITYGDLRRGDLIERIGSDPPDRLLVVDARRLDELDVVIRLADPTEGCPGEFDVVRRRVVFVSGWSLVACAGETP